MRAGVSVWAWTFPLSPADVEPLLRRAHGFGARHVEVGGDACGRVDPSLVKDLLEELDLTGSVCGLFGAERDVSSLDPSVREAGFAHARDCIKFAASAGISLVVGSFAGAGGNQLLPEGTRSHRLNLAIDGLLQLSSAAEDVGVRIAVEALNRYENNLLNTTASVSSLVKELPENVGILADTFHMSIEERNFADALMVCGDRLFHVHAVSNYRGAPAAQPDDCVDWSSVFGALSSLDYSGALVIETVNPACEALAEAACFWRTMADSQDELVRQGLSFLSN